MSNNSKKATSAAPREYEVQCWFSYHTRKPATRGYPKTECGVLGKSNGAAGALRAIAQGFATKVVIIHRPTRKVVLTAFPEKVPGTHIRAVRVVKGEA